MSLKSCPKLSVFQDKLLGGHQGVAPEHLGLSAFAHPCTLRSRVSDARAERGLSEEDCEAEVQYRATNCRWPARVFLEIAFKGL